MSRVGVGVGEGAERVMMYSHLLLRPWSEFEIVAIETQLIFF